MPPNGALRKNRKTIMRTLSLPCRFLFIALGFAVMLSGCGSSDPAFYTITGNVSNPGSGGLAGVTVELAGDQTQTVSTDANGNYSFIVPHGEYRVTPTLGSTAFAPPDSVLEVKDAQVSGIDFLVAPVMPPQEANTWREIGSMTYKRGMQAATLLADGRVLVAGGIANNGGTRASAELYDPAKGKWTTTGYMSYKREDHTATRLTDGKVLVTGGLSENKVARASAELYDPATGKWTLTDPLNFARSFHTSTLLADGKVLVTGGENGRTATFLALASAELYDPATGKWTVTGSLNYKRRYHTATLLTNGRILVAGGNDTSNTLASAEIYDPATGQWSATGAMTDDRESHTATLLADGRVLVVGGWNANGPDVTGSAEIYDPGTGLWTTTNPLTYPRSDHSATLLINHKVLVTGGVGYTVRASSELYDPVTGTWSSVGDLKYKRTRHTATLLNDGTVLAAGGTLAVDDSVPVHASAELFYPGN
jgi:N-acetylneuraminic acid mutarotase